MSHIDVHAKENGSYRGRRAPRRPKRFVAGGHERIFAEHFDCLHRERGGVKIEHNPPEATVSPSTLDAFLAVPRKCPRNYCGTPWATELHGRALGVGLREVAFRVYGVLG